MPTASVQAEPSPSQASTEAAIGFVLVTYKNPDQLLRLVHTLNRVYGDPPIAIHHDFGQCDPGAARFPANVAFVRPHTTTGWGTFGVCEGTVRALEVLYGHGEGPRWFTLLSGCDYPLQPAATVLADLERGGYDAHMTHTRIQRNAAAGTWEGICVDRYLRAPLTLPWPLPPWRRPLHVRQPLITRFLLPWSRTLQCYAGSQWFSANRRAARAILHSHREDQRLREFYAHTARVCDESYFHTILANTPSLKLHNHNWRYIDWGTGGAHPRVLGSEDMETALASGCHFARKFDQAQERAVLDALDQHLNTSHRHP